MNKIDTKKTGRPGKFLLILFCVIIGICLAWAAFSRIGRIEAGAVIPEQALVRISIHNPVQLWDGIVSHESLPEIEDSRVFSPALPLFRALKENPVLKKPLVRLAARGKLEAALLADTASNRTGPLLAAWDMGLFSPLLRILPLLSNFTAIPNLYYVRTGKDSRFEYRMEGRTLFIFPRRNLLIFTDSLAVVESRGQEGSGEIYQSIRPASYDAALLLSPAFLNMPHGKQNPVMAAILRNIDFPGAIEAGVSVLPKKLELRITAQVLPGQAALLKLTGQRSLVPGLAERLPASTQYSTILSAGTLEELYGAALAFSPPALDETLKRADSSARAILGLSLDDILFSWTGNEFAAFGMEGRPSPVYAVQIADERKRQEIFDKAFKTIALNENTRLNLDGTRIPRIEIPGFLEALLRQWDLHLPSPYYTVYNGYLFASESAEALLASLRAMQKNDVLPGTEIWRNIAGGKSASSALCVYYSLDHSLPFFLRGNIARGSFLEIYRQGLLRVNFDRGLTDISLTLIPGFGSGVTLVSAYPLDLGGTPSNRIYGSGNDSRVFLSSGDSAFSIDLADNSVHELPGQGPAYVIPAPGITEDSGAAAWVISALGRVTLVNVDMEPLHNFPVLTGRRISSPPAAHGGKVYLCDENGNVHTIDENGNQSVWHTSFAAALRSPPSFLTTGTGRTHKSFAAVYPKSFFGELWLLDTDGRALPGWPAPAGSDESSGIAFGSPLLFAHNSRAHVAFITQEGELSIYNESAVLLPGFPLALDGIFYLQPVFDGEYLWLASADGKLFQISLDGEVLFQQIPGFQVKEEGHLMLFDCNRDTVPEIFISGEGNAMYGYSRNFRSLESFPLPVWGKPLIAGLGGDTIECIGLGMDKKLYRWRFR